MNELIFTIYRYKIDKLPAVQCELFDEKKLADKSAANEQLLEKFIPESGKVLDLWNAPKKKRDGDEVIEKDSYNNKVVEHKDNIIVLALQANSSKLIYDEDWGEHPEPNHMPLYVIMDNRHDDQFIAIQRVAMDTDKTADILQNSFNYMLNKTGYRFRIFRLKNHLKFIEAVYHIKDKLHDHVNKLVFDFDKNQVAMKKLEGRFVHKLTEWIGKFADSGQLSANISDDEKLRNEDVLQEIELAADLCFRNPHYNLLVRFEHFGIYRYGNDIKAQFGLDENVLEQFVGPSRRDDEPRLAFASEEEEMSVISLPGWLDDIKKLYKDYEEEALSARKGKRANRCKI